MNEGQLQAPAIAGEFRGVRFKDARLSNRLVHVAESCARSPQKSLPQSVMSKAELNATYAFFSNKRVGAKAVIEAHADESIRRASREVLVLVAHDTTEFEYSTHREGLGHLRSERDHGCLMHLSLALSADGNRRPLGVLSAEFWTRTLQKEDLGSGAERAKVPDKESARWLKQVDAIEQRVGDQARLVHLMDREGDAFTLLAGMAKASYRFVIRMARDRVAREDDESLREKVTALMARATVARDVEVQLSSRAQKKSPMRATMPPRQTRVAKLALSGARMQLKKPPYLRDLPMWLDVNVVCAKEIDAPDGIAPVEWVLFTSEPIDTEEQVAAVVDHYRARWVIEELFKALKTGCEVEKLQLETYPALKNAIAMYLVLAWRMLLMRTLTRSQPDTHATAALSPSELDVIREFQPDAKLPLQPTIAQALVAVAMMGGYIKHKIGPGWLTLGRGLERLTTLETAWSAALAKRSPPENKSRGS